ncbi:MAG: sel1 repeat family protein [Planctomycetaceae bacterium]|nr:sel1 repeat family protein [Planctomycetaceae bacterium]
MNVTENSQNVNHENNQPESPTTSSERSWLQYIFMIIGFAVGSATGGLVGCILGGMIGGVIGFGINVLLNANKDNKNNTTTPTNTEPNNQQNNIPTEKKYRSGKVIENIPVVCIILAAGIWLSYIKVTEKIPNRQEERLNEILNQLGETQPNKTYSGVPLAREKEPSGNEHKDKDDMEYKSAEIRKIFQNEKWKVRLNESWIEECLQVNHAEFDWRTPLDKLKIAADEGKSEAIIELASRYSFGYGGCTEDSSKRAELLIKVASPRSFQTLRNVLLQGNNEKEEQEIAEQVINDMENKDSNIMLCKGICYQQGYCVAKNYEEAINCFKKAAENGSSNAEYRLGVAYFCGEGVQENIKETFYWLDRAANKGDAAAMMMIFSIALVAVDENIEPQAINCLKKLTEIGYEPAKLMLQEIETIFDSDE